MDDWERRYKRKVLDYIRAPEDVDLYTVVITSEWADAWGYSEYTNEPAEFDIRITYKDPTSGRDRYARLSNEECAEFLRSLG